MVVMVQRLYQILRSCLLSDPRAIGNRPSNSGLVSELKCLVDFCPKECQVLLLLRAEVSDLTRDPVCYFY